MTRKYKEVFFFFVPLILELNVHFWTQTAEHDSAVLGGAFCVSCPVKTVDGEKRKQHGKQKI